MTWEWLNRRLKKGRSGVSAAEIRQPDVRWVAAADNPWGVPVLDVRPVTLQMLAFSEDPKCAQNAGSFGQDDGTSFIGIEPAGPGSIPVGLRFPIDRILADGALFVPSQMEHKWAIYFHRGHMIFIRSWLRKVQVVARIETEGDYIEVVDLRGQFAESDEEPSLTRRVLDYLLRSHALNMVYPAPLPRGLEADPKKAAAWCFSMFGNRVQFATPHALPTTPPKQLLRTHSSLHIAVARGQLEAVRSYLDAGLPADLLAGDGLAPLHWAVVRDDTAIFELLLERASPIDVRSAEGATPLMTAVQGRSVAKAALLLDHGADPNARDNKGFTALHRAAEMGDVRIVKLLLERGAFPHPDAAGHTPLSLAQGRAQTAVVKLLSSR